MGTMLEEFLARALSVVPMASWGLGRDGHTALKALVGELRPPHRVALLKAAVAELPRLRASADSSSSTKGALLYSTVGVLYGARLPLTENDLCDVLLSAGHDCGHGLDTRPPFDLARTYMRKHGYSPRLGAAIATFISNLPKSSAIQVKELRRSAAVLAVLGADPVGGKASWIRSLQAGLSSLEPPERTVWENLILAMSVSERMVMPNTWGAAANRAVAELGAKRVAQRLRHWWPDGDPGALVDLQDGGAQILKHFIWLLDYLPRTDGEPLATRLADLQFKSRTEPMSVLKPAAAYLEESIDLQAEQALARLRSRILAAGG